MNLSKIFFCITVSTTVLIVSLACGSSNSSTALTPSGTAAITGSVSEGVLNKAQLSGNVYEVTASINGLVVNGELTTSASSNTVGYNITGLNDGGTYLVELKKGTASRTTLVSTVAVATQTGQSKPRFAGTASSNVEMNMFSSYIANHYKKSLKSDSAANVMSSINDAFNNSGLSSLAGIKVKKGLPTRIDAGSGNTLPIKVKAKASAKVKLISQMAKSVVYMDEESLSMVSDNLNNFYEELAFETSMDNITNFYKGGVFTEVISEVKDDLQRLGLSYRDMVAEVDPILANLDFVDSINNLAFDADFGTALSSVFSSADNLTKQLLSYELALEVYVDDFPEFDYNVGTDEFFKDIYFGVEFDASLVTAFAQEAMGELGDIFDSEFSVADQDFAFEFTKDDVTALFSNTFKEIREGMGDFGTGVSIGADEFDDLFSGIDFQGQDFEAFEDITVALDDIFDEDELADVLGELSGVQIFAFHLAHPTYGRREIRASGQYEFSVGSLAPVFVLDFFPNADLEALSVDQLDDQFTLKLTDASGNRLSSFYSVLADPNDKSRAFVALKKTNSTTLRSHELQPGENYNLTLEPASGVTLINANSGANLQGKLMVKDITFTTPFDSLQQKSQVDLLAFFRDFFMEDIFEAQIDDQLKTISPSVFHGASSTGETAKAMKLTLTSGILSQSGTYELRIDTSTDLQWSVDGSTLSVGSDNYINRQFFDIASSSQGMGPKIVGTAATTVDPLFTATPSILIHSRHGIFINSSATDLGLFDSGKISVRAHLHNQEDEDEIVDESGDLVGGGDGDGDGNDNSNGGGLNSDGKFVLQILHSADADGDGDLINNTKVFSAILKAFRDSVPNTVTLYSGDAWIPGSFYTASADDSMADVLGVPGNGRAHIAFLNAMGFQASVFGNHEFDAGPGAIADILATESDDAGNVWEGALFPYLSTNLDFSASTDLADMVVEGGLDGSALAGKITSYITLDINGVEVGVIGATTPKLDSISSPGDVAIFPSDSTDLDALAAIIQDDVDSLTSMGVDKIILLAHMQQIAIEKQLAKKLDGVDVIIAGGSNSVLLDEDDRARAGHHSVGPYPVLMEALSGDPVLVVNTDGDYEYLGRLIVTFDSNGVIDTDQLDPFQSGAYATDADGLDELGLTEGDAIPEVVEVADALQSVVQETEGNIFGKSLVYLNGVRESVRTEETNLGNLTADANRWYASSSDDSVVVSIKNGGGIRAPIGQSIVAPGSTGEPEWLPTAEIPGVKEEGEISQTDIQTTLRFNNSLTLLTVTAEQLVDILEHAVSATGPDSTPGQFPQVSGMRFSFAPGMEARSTDAGGNVLTPGERIRSLVVETPNGDDIVVQRGKIMGDGSRSFRLVTLGFLAGGGDDYPFPTDTAANVVDLEQEGVQTGSATFADDGTEQDALSEYLLAMFSSTPFDERDTEAEKDRRIVNLAKVEDAGQGLAVMETARYANDSNAFDKSAAEIVAHDPAGQRVFVVNAQQARVDVLDASDPTALSFSTNLVATDHWSSASGINSVDVSGNWLAVAVENSNKQANGQVFIYDLSNLSLAANVTVGALPDMLTFTPDGSKILVANEGEPNGDYSVDPEGSVSIIDISIPTSPIVTHITFEDFNTGGTRASELPSGVRIFGNFGRTQLTALSFDASAGNIVVSDASSASANMWLTISGEGDPLPYQISHVESASNTLMLTTALDDEETATSTTVAGNMKIYLHDGQSSVAQDLEPEYIAVAPNGTKAWVAFQENNAMAVIDLMAGNVQSIIALGTKDHNIPGNELDVSDKDGDINNGVNIRNQPVRGMYMPDSIAAFEILGQVYIITANEGDAREYDAYVEEIRFRDAPLDADAFAHINADGRFGDKTSVGRLATTITNDTDGDGDLDQAHVYGARSFTIWDENGRPVFDSGSDFELITARILGKDFNNDNDENSGDSRSDAKGPEPEAIAVGQIGSRLYAFIGLERVGGVMIYDITNPYDARFIRYVNNRDFSFDIEGRIDDGGEAAHLAGDLGPENIRFVTAEESSSGHAQIIIGSEVSGTVTIMDLSFMQEGSVDPDFFELRAPIHLEELGRFASDVNPFDESAAEIVAYDAMGQRIFVVNAHKSIVDILDASDPSSPTLSGNLDATTVWSEAGGINSVDAHGHWLAVAVENDDKQANGQVFIYDLSDLSLAANVIVGALPDMVTFTPDGMKVLVANEGEPNGDYSIDPEGSVSIIDLTDMDNIETIQVTFEDFNSDGSRASELPSGVRVFGNYGRTMLSVTAVHAASGNVTVDDVTSASANMWLTISGEGDPLPYRIASIDTTNKVLTMTTSLDDEETVTSSTFAGNLKVYLHDGQSSVSQDLEPEYIAVSKDGATAYVALQENNAVAVIDIDTASVEKILALGTKDHNLPGNELDVSDKDDGVNIMSQPVFGMYMPDSIAAIEIGGENFFLTANEGDAREYDAYVEEMRFRDAPRDTDAFADIDVDGRFNDKTNVGRLATTLTADTDGDGDIDLPLAYGARSFTIWDENGRPVFDSGSDFERITARILGDDFNNDNDENSGDSRSDAKGPEPEAIAVGEVDGRLYAFIGLERTGGIMVYDITRPSDSRFVQYLNDRDFDFAIETRIDDGGEPAHLAGDLGPEGFEFVSVEDSPSGNALLIVGSEVSGTTTIYDIRSAMLGGMAEDSRPARLREVGRYADDGNGFDESAAEIVAYHVEGQKAFVINAEQSTVDVLDLSSPEDPELFTSIDATIYWSEAGGINSVAVSGSKVALAVESSDKQANGRMILIDAYTFAELAIVEVGALPDMVTFTPDGMTVLVAKEGEPNGDYSIDPEGSVTLIDVSDTDNVISTAVTFDDFNTGGSRASELSSDVRVFGNFGRTELTMTAFDATSGNITVSDISSASANMWLTISGVGDPLPYQIASIDTSNSVLSLTTSLDDEETAPEGTLASDLKVYLHDGQSSVSQDLEPEYIAVTPDGMKAIVSLQENNALAVIDIPSAQVDSILGLGTKDHSLPGHELDVSDKDGRVNIRNHPVHGFYMPDSIAAFEHQGKNYVITANEGDAREYDAYVEELRFRDIPRDPDVFAAIDPNGKFDDKEDVGRLATTLTNDTDGDGDIDIPVAFGARSFSIWSLEGHLVFDSGSDFERITARVLGEDFNNNNDENSGDSRSDAKGPEPEAITVGMVEGRRYAFIGLERTGGIMMYDIQDPYAPRFVQYINNRDYDFDIEGRIDDDGEPAHLAGDLGPEGFAFVSAEDSPNGKALLIVGNEVSGTTTIYEISR